ncbi:hypothetical protein FLONG3_3067 [Fusarium longipes]|uniref:MOSC domain-containing protein n=1 Tax=Fusarium longipes TaxID=694270 RepID=A0A395T2D5_9HYPO|nr:hypothetical protein FLONG3_3067 [Fusarium longipes]
MDEATLWIIVSGIVLATSITLLLQGQRARETGLEVTQLYVYPVKGIRGCALDKARIGPFGFEGDRTFCLQKIRRNGDTDPKYETMLIGYDLKLALFQASIDYDQNQVLVNWNNDDSVHFPLKPSLEGRPIIQTSLHASTTRAYDMGDDLSKWFSDRIGQEVRLVYIGDGSRAVLGSVAPHSSDALQKASLTQKIKNSITFSAHEPERLAFNDIAHYLVVTEESNDEASSRLKEGYSMDITKFRPNIVVRGASKPFAEDYWGELSFSGGVRMALTANCFRCQSITVDYETGKTATDDRGMVWKRLNKDRRVDKGAKYSPVFGRYGFCYGDDTNRSISIGQKVDVTRVNKERTTFGEFDASGNE